MPSFLDRIGFGGAVETKEDALNLMAYALENGKPVIGYYGIPYINHHIGDAQLIIRLGINKEKNQLETVGFDTHADGNSIWKVRLLEWDIDDDDDLLSKRVMAAREDGHGMTVINIVNADVLPSFAKDEIYTLQMIAFPTDIKYYERGEDYEKDGTITGEDKGWLIGEGAVLPLGFLANHTVKGKEDLNETKEYDSKTDDIVAVRGVVKKLYCGVHEFGEKEINAYVRCVIDTEYGELEIDHDIDIIDEESRKNIKIGSTVVAMVVLSGDAANYEYADGFVRDEENNLRLIRYTFINGDPERLRRVLSEDAEYLLDSNGKTYKGRDDIISRIKYVQENGDHKYSAHMATITSIDEDGEAEYTYPVGTRCVILASEDGKDYESIAFVTTDDDGYITKIHTSMENRYHFSIDEFPDNSDNIELPDSYEY